VEAKKTGRNKGTHSPNLMPDEMVTGRHFGLFQLLHGDPGGLGKQRANLMPPDIKSNGFLLAKKTPDFPNSRVSLARPWRGRTVELKTVMVAA
jgi:hypothetical protein